MVVWVSVAVAGVAALVAGLFLARRLRGAQHLVALSPEGYQEARIVINGRYRPALVRVQQGIPVRIRFLRREDNPCSERVVFAGFGIDRRLPAFQETTVEFVPTSTGTFLFTCQWGMYRGRLVVMAPGRRVVRAVTAEGNMAEAKRKGSSAQHGQGTAH